MFRRVAGVLLDLESLTEYLSCIREARDFRAWQAKRGAEQAEQQERVPSGRCRQWRCGQWQGRASLGDAGRNGQDGHGPRWVAHAGAQAVVQGRRGRSSDVGRRDGQGDGRKLAAGAHPVVDGSGFRVPDYRLRPHAHVEPCGWAYIRRVHGWVGATRMPASTMRGDPTRPGSFQTGRFRHAPAWHGRRGGGGPQPNRCHRVGSWCTTWVSAGCYRGSGRVLTARSANQLGSSTAAAVRRTGLLQPLPMSMGRSARWTS